MAKIKIIQVGDIHYENSISENNELVLTAFFDDIKQECSETDNDNTYCIISGDLVNRGSNREYELFYDKFINKLTKYVPIKNIICIPGNHDLDRTIIENHFEEHNSITDNNDEEELNDLIKEDKDNIIKDKFNPFLTFCNNKLHKSNYNHYGYSETLVPEISIFCLNSALLSCGGYQDYDDCQKLKIETSELNKWINENKGRTKILLLHHPINYLTEYYQMEINSMLRNKDLDIIISGHIHDQNCIKIGNQLCFSSPQLFSSKHDINGYAIYEFEDGVIQNVKYREWISRQRRFMTGQSFSGTESGIIEFTQNQQNCNDTTLAFLKNDFQEAMKSYSTTPKWSERYLSDCIPNNISKEKEHIIDYINIINNPDYYQIIAAPQFGLTCYARYLAMQSWKIKQEFWLYLDCSDIRLSTIADNLKTAAFKYNCLESNIKCLLLDNWYASMKDAQKILLKIKQIIPNIPIIIFSNFDDQIVLNGINTEESHDGFKQLYLKELNKKAIRNIVKDFNTKDCIADDNVVLNRVCMDIKDLNIHRTPLNCLQLLLSFKQNFNERPINRSKVFSYILQLIFNNPGKLFYGEVLDEDDCKFILGGFCEYLLRNQKDSFSEKDFLNETSTFASINYITANIPNLLQILKNNQIIIESKGNLKFRFTCWIYYFAAERMKLDSNFFDFMFNTMHSVYVPDIIEFYTGTDGAREDAVKIITSELAILSERVQNKLGISADFNPFEHIKWQRTEAQNDLTQKDLEKRIHDSKLPEEIKDSLSDNDYNSIKPYNQTIYKYMEEYDLKNLMDLLRSASRALRNSLQITPYQKEALSQEIYKGWEDVFRGLFLIAPILAKTGFGGVGGASFKLSGDFPKEYAECLTAILVAMPINIVNWYKDDIYSDKLAMLFEKFMIEYGDPIVKHTIALLVSTCRPTNWEIVIKKYIQSIHKNSYYLGDLYVCLRYNYSVQLMSSKELNQTENLIKTCWAKHNIGSKAIGPMTTSKVSNTIIPERNNVIE